MHTHQRYDGLAIRMSFEVVLRFQTLLELEMVVDLPVNSKDDFSIVTDERLGTGV